MKAILLKNYGAPDQLELTEVPTPSPQANEVLIQVRATAINDWDWGLVRGKPFYIRLLCGFFRPKIKIPGAEISGVIEEVGSAVGKFKVGDEVYGDISECGFGGFAEYVCVPETALAKKPENISFEEAASLPHAAMLAIQGLLDLGELREGQNLLINGAGGGVGTLGIQIAKTQGVLKATGVDSAVKTESMKQQGFTKTIDYQTQDFTQESEQYDLVLDTKTNRPPLSYLRSLLPGGKYVTVGGKTRYLLLTALLAPIIHLFTKKRIRIVGIKTNRDLELINSLCDQGKLSPLVEGPFALEDAPRLIQHFGDGLHRGKVILSPGFPTRAK